MKRYLGVFLALVFLLVGLTAVASATIKDYSWEEDGTYLIDASTGKNMEFTGWKQDSFEWDPDWSYWFYSEGKGKLIEGWKQIGGVWYYFWPEMCTSSWYDQDKDTVYLFNEKGAWTGVSATGTDGWFKQDNKWYYIRKNTDQWEGKTYVWKEFYSNSNWMVDDKCYYFKDGVMQNSGWVSETNTWQGTTYTSWFYANPDGELATGWKQIGGIWYYFNDWGWMYNDGFYVIDKGRYAFDKSGAMLANKWYSRTLEYDDGNKEVHWAYMGADGAAKTGWFKVGNDWYYSNEYGWMLTGWLPDEDALYYMKDSGAMAKNEWIKNEGIWYYFKGDGTMAENEWIQDGSAWYWLKDGGDMAHGETVTINGKDYKFADNGVWIP